MRGGHVTPRTRRPVAGVRAHMYACVVHSAVRAIISHLEPIRSGAIHAVACTAGIKKTRSLTWLIHHPNFKSPGAFSSLKGPSIGRVVRANRSRLFVLGLILCVQRSYSKWRSYRLDDNTTIRSVLDRQLFCYVLFGGVCFFISAYKKHTVLGLLSNMSVCFVKTKIYVLCHFIFKNLTLYSDYIRRALFTLI